ncbi:MAG: flavin reductase family protein [Gammaproteobacteria bacterium]|nr:flavin reductase family protein [Gammaproteobacteria bacterium]
MTDKTELPVKDLFGLEYWPALPAFLISTADEAGKPHVAPYSLVFFPSYTNVAEDDDTPKIISLVIGDYDTYAGAKESRTYRNITSTGEFVVNVPTAKIVECVNTTVFPAEDKFATSGLSPEPSAKIAAPAVAECPANYECELLRVEEHRWLGEVLYGRIVAVRVDSSLRDLPAKDRMAPLAPVYHYAYDHYNGTYYGLGDILLEEIDE